jgi:hypothetical protein
MLLPHVIADDLANMTVAKQYQFLRCLDLLQGHRFHRHHTKMSQLQDSYVKIPCECTLAANKTVKCKAKRLLVEGKVPEFIGVHNHPPPLLVCLFSSQI